MARGYTTRRLEVFSLHVRDGQAVVDYEQFFRDLSLVRKSDRSYKVGDKLIALPVLTVRKNKHLQLMAYEGEPGVAPLFYNIDSGAERYATLRGREVVATKTHGLIDLVTREAIIEYNQRGAKTDDIALALEEAARSINGYEEITVELNPVADKSFVAAIQSFARIKIGMLKIARPNLTWTKYQNFLSATAEDSDAHTVSVSMYAERGKTLSRTAGLVKFIIDLASHPISVLKGASVTGVRPNEQGDTTITLAHHFEHTRVNVQKTARGHVEDADINRRIKDYMNRRAKQRNNA
jgi:hypothetical protein